MQYLERFQIPEGEWTGAAWLLTEKKHSLLNTYFLQVTESKVDVFAELCSQTGWASGDLEVPTEDNCIVWRRGGSHLAGKESEGQTGRDSFM